MPFDAPANVKSPHAPRFVARPVFREHRRKYSTFVKINKPLEYERIHVKHFPV